MFRGIDGRYEAIGTPSPLMGKSINILNKCTLHTKHISLLSGDVCSDKNFLQAAVEETLEQTHLKLNDDYEIIEIMEEITKTGKGKIKISKETIKMQLFAAFSKVEKVIKENEYYTFTWVTLEEA